MDFEVDQVLRNIGAVVTLGLGAMSLVNPSLGARFVNLEPQGKIGVSEIRATYGGLFAAMGLFVLITQSSPGFTLLGIGWAGAAAGRLVSVFVDRSLAPKNFMGIAFEGVIAALLLARW